MNSFAKNELSRSQTVLGALIEITASGLAEAELRSAVNAAFAAIERVQKLLNAHNPASELSLLNREAAQRAVTVSRETYQILRRADRLAAESQGAFDFTVTPSSHRESLSAETKRESAGSWRDVMLLRRKQVRFLRPLALDLSGIVKGYAVDRAIEVLRKNGVTSARVNAGGDVRVFGAEISKIHLCHPANPQTSVRMIELEQAALVTSRPFFSEKKWSDKRVSHLVDSLRQAAITGAVSVSVRAKECWLADALTKVVLNAPKLAEKILARHNAEAFVLAA